MHKWYSLKPRFWRKCESCLLKGVMLLDEDTISIKMSIVRAVMQCSSRNIFVFAFRPIKNSNLYLNMFKYLFLKRDFNHSFWTVLDKPIPETHFINKDCIKNSTQTVSCNVRGNQPKNVQWVKVSKGTAKAIKISLSGDKYYGGTVEKPSLRIRNFVMDDEGTYVCCAANNAGIGLSNGTFLTYICKCLNLN